MWETLTPASGSVQTSELRDQGGTPLTQRLPKMVLAPKLSDIFHQRSRFGDKPCAISPQRRCLKKNVMIQRLEVEADERFSFVQKKANKQWIWINMDATSRQVIAFHVGDRSRRSAKRLWAKIPLAYRQQATFYTNQYVVMDITTLDSLSS
jgi:hypothetical protein